ncbi:MAG: lamin tail domain-containing protein [Pirellulales bacterium]
MRAIAAGIFAGAALLTATSGYGQVVLNEIVKEQRTAGAGAVSPDTREFIELYNAGGTAVDLSTYSIFTQVMNTGGTIEDFLPAAMIGPGDYFVIAADGRGIVGADHYISIGAADELFPDLANILIELRNSGATVDAVGFDTFRAPQTSSHSATQLAQTGNGIWGQAQSYDIPETVDFKRLSNARYRDGRDTNVNGRDFGFLPITQGASNNLPENAVHTVPNVSSLNHGANVPAYNYGFVPVRAVNPATADTINPSAISDSPRNGGRVMVMWDETGGGNSAYSKELVNKFDIYAYLDSTPLNIPGDWEAEYTAYGIGTTEPLFGTPNPNQLIPSGTATTLTQNSTTGIGWLYERFQHHPDQGGGNVFKLSLIDFGQGGNSVPGGTNTTWDIIAQFDLAPENSGWHHLGIDYDPTTGEVVAVFDDHVETFTTATDLLGTFYVGYREALTAVPGANVGIVRPATFDLFVEPGLTGDYNEDGKVDAADYVVWRKNPGAFGGAQGYTDWAANFGAMSGAGGGASAVPEPSSVALVMLGLLGFVAQRGRPLR